MSVMRFETDKVIANVHYTNLPTKENLEEACAIFLKKAMQDIGRKAMKNEKRA